MAFRDDRQAIELRIAAIESELLELAAHIERLEKDREELRSHARVGRGVWLAPIGAAVVLAGAFVVLETGMPEGVRETLYGNVREIDGEAPLAAGEKCAIFIDLIDADEDRCAVHVLCDDRLVYGGGTLGGTTCEDFDELPSRCADTRPTVESGDPMLRFDREEGSIVIEDAQPVWRLSIEIAGTVSPEDR